MHIVEVILKNKKMSILILILLILLGLRMVGGVSTCNGEYKLGSCSEVGRVYN